MVYCSTAWLDPIFQAIKFSFDARVIVLARMRKHVGTRAKLL